MNALQNAHLKRLDTLILQQEDMVYLSAVRRMYSQPNSLQQTHLAIACLERSALDFLKDQRLDFNIMKFDRSEPKAPGTKIGQLTIIESLEFSDRGLAKKQWWYLVRCNCGTVEEANNSQLHKKWACRDCMEEHRGKSISKAKRSGEEPIERVESVRGPDLPPGVPNFLTMRLRGE